MAFAHPTEEITYFSVAVPFEPRNKALHQRQGVKWLLLVVQVLKNGTIKGDVNVGRKPTEEADSQARPDEHSYGDIFAPYVALRLESTQMTTLEANFSK